MTSNDVGMETKETLVLIVRSHKQAFRVQYRNTLTHTRTGKSPSYTQTHPHTLKCHLISQKP